MSNPIADRLSSGSRPPSLSPDTFLGGASGRPAGWPSSWDDNPLPDAVPMPEIQIAQALPTSDEPPVTRGGDDSNDPNSTNWHGFELVLPDGSTIPDDDPKSTSPTGTVRTPVRNLDEVAAAGRAARERLRRQAGNRLEVPVAVPNFLLDAAANLGHGGRFDYQRRGTFHPLIDEIIDRAGLHGVFEQRPQFLPIANINVGLYSQQSGLTLEQTLARAGWFARHFSSNARPDQPYGLDSRTARFIEIGYKLGQSGRFGHAATLP